MVNEDAGQLLANGLVDENCGHRAVDAAREATNDLIKADLFLDAVDGLFLEGGHGPVAMAATDVDDEVFQESGAIRGVHHLEMKLGAVELALVVGDGGEGGSVGG